MNNLQSKGLLPALLLLFAGCTEVIKIPASDPTPPTVKMFEQAPAQQDYLTPSDGPISRAVGPNDKIEFTGSGEDLDSGVKLYLIRGDIYIDCRYNDQSNVASEVHLYEYAESEAVTTAPGFGKTKLFANAIYQISQLMTECPSGTSALSIGGTFHAEAVNNLDSTAKTQLYSFHWP